MKHYKIFLITIITTLIALFTSCYKPFPLYGTWTDNSGNKIVLNEDYTFEASILDSSDTTISYSGNWRTAEQVLIFTIIDEEGNSYTRNTTWDVVGAILTLNWTIRDYTRQLTLYHTAY